MIGRWSCAAVLFFLISLGQASAQTPLYAFRIAFTDKNFSPSLANAAQFLSQRALDRRARLNIALDEKDRPVSAKYIDSTLLLTGGSLQVTSRWLNQCVIMLTDSSDISSLQNQDFIDSITLVGYYPAGLNRPAGHPGKLDKEQAGGNAAAMMRTANTAPDYGYATPQTELVNGNTLHEIGYMGDDMLIAVLDAGFLGFNNMLCFDSMRMNGKLLDTYDFILSQDSVYGYSAHGTECVSLIAANIPGQYIGSAPRAAYALYRTEDVLHNPNGYDMLAELDYLTAGAERADSLGADVINASLGYNDMGYPQGSSIPQSQMDGKTTLAAKMANIAAGKGILFVCTSGNEGDLGILTPGDADSALTVGNVGENREPAGNSGKGPNASGVIKPDVCAQGFPARIINASGNIVSGQGTSYAAPQIAGWAACLWQGKPATSVYDLKQAIIRSADRFGAPQPKAGYGVPDFRIAGAILGIIDTTKDTTVTRDSIGIAPTAFTGQTGVRIYIQHTSDNQKWQFALFDLNGRRIWADEKVFNAGVHYYMPTLPANLPGGMYFFKASGSNQDHTVKIVKY